MKKQKIKKDSVTKIASDWGRLGGLAVVKKRGKKYMREIGKKGAEARWANNKKK